MDKAGVEKHNKTIFSGTKNSLETARTFSTLFSDIQLRSEGGLLSNIGTFLMPVKSIVIFKTLFFLPCVLLGQIRFAVLFYSIFLIAGLSKKLKN